MAGTLKRVWLIERNISKPRCGALWEPAGFSADMRKRDAEKIVKELNNSNSPHWDYQVAEYIRKDRCLRYDD